MNRKKILYIVGFIIFILSFTSYASRNGCDDPQYNQASFEKEALVPSLLPFSKGLTFAQIKRDTGTISTLLIIRFDGQTVEAIDVSKIGAIERNDIFETLASLDWFSLESAVFRSELAETLSVEKFLPAAGNTGRHVASGTNFAEHAAETNSTSVFNFPKFGKATPSRTTVSYNDKGLLDYEVEVCTRYDRDIKSVEDFDAARKGFFLCGDFTNRATLLKLIDPDNLDSGNGFSDAKSGPNFFPSGPFLVIPKDWRSFIAEERMTTQVNQAPRQDARGGEMIMDFRQLVEKLLTDTQPRFLYQDNRFSLTPNKQLDAGMTLMSGTSEGVIFTPPTRCDIATGVQSYIFGDILRQSLYNSVIQTLIEREKKSGHFLQPHDQIHFASSHMGTIDVIVTPESKASN